MLLLSPPPPLRPFTVRLLRLLSSPLQLRATTLNNKTPRPLLARVCPRVVFTLRDIKGIAELFRAPPAQVVIPKYNLFKNCKNPLE